MANTKKRSSGKSSGAHRVSGRDTISPKAITGCDEDLRRVAWSSSLGFQFAARYRQSDSPCYDSLVAKRISCGHERIVPNIGRNHTEAIARMRRALDMFVVEGIYTTIPLHQRILADPDFIAGKTDTSYLQSHR